MALKTQQAFIYKPICVNKDNGKTGVLPIVNEVKDVIEIGDLSE